MNIGLKPFRNLSWIVCALLGWTAASAQETIEIVKEAAATKPIPVSLAGFSGEVANVLRFDLEVGGCEIISGTGAQFSVIGSANPNVQGELKDVITGKSLLHNRYSDGSPRAQAHHFADDLLEKITGKRGVSRFRIAFKGEQGGKSEIYVSDFDGAGAVAVTTDNALVASPAWVPGKKVLYYTSYKAGYPYVYAHNLGTGERRPIARFPGLNTSATISPDGSQVALILSKGGSPDVYVGPADGGNWKQLSATREDESSPCWSPTGDRLAFISAREGQPALYVVPATGGSARRIRTIGAGRVSEPDWSPDGKWIAFTAMWGEFTICVVPAQGGDVLRLAPGEDASWAPNSRTLVFTRRSKGRSTLSLLDVPTKRVKDLRHNLGNCSQPSWAK